MHILGGLLAVLVGLGVLFWRLKAAAQMGRELGDAALDARSFVRRLFWGRRLHADPLEEIKDPREAATILMIAVAREKGDVTRSQKTAILGEMERHFALERRAAEEMLIQMSWLTRDLVDPADRMDRLSRPIIQSCTPDERNALAAMLATIAGVDGPMTGAQETIISAYRATLARHPIS